MEIKGCKLEFELVPQSPMIHFQWDESGVTLRASEVKPKLDKFLEKKKGSIPVEWKIDPGKPALNYKMRISLRKKSQIDKPNNIFYGNTHDESKNDDFKEKQAVTSYPNITVVCFNSELLNFIKENIWEFFIVTNFGTMQSKGFGSFIIDDDNKTEKDIVKAFKDNDVKVVYKASFSAKETIEDRFAVIDTFYRIMTSGYNLTNVLIRKKSFVEKPKGYARSQLFHFVKEKFGMENEKKYLKIVAKTDGEGNQIEKRHKYVRGLMGKGEIVHTSPNNKNKYTVTITHNQKNNKIERIPSIVRFKIINETVYILGYPISEKIYGKRFEFRFKKPKRESNFSEISPNVFNRFYILEIPEKSVFNNEYGFPIEEFLDYYVSFYNGERGDKDGEMPLPERFRDISWIKFKKVVKCE